MDISYLNPLPEWEDRFQNIDKDEAWKWKETLQAAENLYNQWREVFGLVMAFVETLPEEEDESLGMKSMIYQNAYIMAPRS